MLTTCQARTSLESTSLQLLEIVSVDNGNIEIELQSYLFDSELEFDAHLRTSGSKRTPPHPLLAVKTRCHTEPEGDTQMFIPLSASACETSVNRRRMHQPKRQREEKIPFPDCLLDWSVGGDCRLFHGCRVDALPRNQAPRGDRNWLFSAPGILSNSQLWACLGRIK